ncbi:MAG: response regulator transcription factor [Anaerolineae bacterium]|nr:response regulator transcription factor [Anaerolineae bacterium]
MNQVLKVRILFIADEPESGQLWTHLLQSKDYEVTLLHSLQEAVNWWAGQASELIIVDVCGPYRGGIEIVRPLRAIVTVPILLLLSDYSEAHALEAYQAGASECVGKPLDPRLFLAKVRVWAAHSWHVPTEALDSFQIGPLRLDTRQRQLVMENGATVKLTNLELRLLHLLVAHAGQVLPTSVIVDRVWGYMGVGDGTLVKNVVYRLRRKIEPNPARPRHIVAVAGEGYTFYP